MSEKLSEETLGEVPSVNEVLRFSRGLVKGGVFRNEEEAVREFKIIRERKLKRKMAMSI